MESKEGGDAGAEHARKLRVACVMCDDAGPMESSMSHPLQRIFFLTCRGCGSKYNVTVAAVRGRG
jgi:translation initiation factor 2 beta subunit (eIF-2beta)/eIF-5